MMRSPRAPGQGNRTILTILCLGSRIGSTAAHAMEEDEHRRTPGGMSRHRMPPSTAGLELGACADPRRFARGLLMGGARRGWARGIGVS